MAQIERQNLQLRGNSKAQTDCSFSIVCEGQSMQILQIAIPPNCSIHIRGKIVYSNNANQIDLKAIPFHIEKFKKFADYPLITHTMHHWQNKSQQMEIVGMAHTQHYGPILIIDLPVYKESFFVNMSYVIASTYSLKEAANGHSCLSNSRLVKFNHKAESIQEFLKNNQKIAFQANSPIIEKYLGAGETFALRAASIIAMSETIQAEKENGVTKLVGPGWVFFDTALPASNRAIYGFLIYVGMMLLFTILMI